VFIFSANYRGSYASRQEDQSYNELNQNSLYTFNSQGPVHHKYIVIYFQQDATLHSLFVPGNCSTCFRWYLHPSSGAHTTVSTASGTCQTVKCYLLLSCRRRNCSNISKTAAGSSLGSDKCQVL